MTLTQGRNTIEIDEGNILVLPLAADTKIFDGALVAVTAEGYAVPGEKNANLKAAGRAETFADNTGGESGAVTVEVKRGVFIWDNDGAEANKVTQAHILSECYILDDGTVTSVSEGTSVCGKVIAVLDDGVAVEIK